MPHHDTLTPRPETIATHHDASAGADDAIKVEVNGKLFRVRLIGMPQGAPSSNGTQLKRAPRASHQKRAVADTGNAVRSPMHGVVVELHVKPGEAVEQGKVVAVIEAMKMMNEIRAHKAGTVSEVHAKPGDTVEAQGALVTLAE